MKQTAAAVKCSVSNLFAVQQRSTYGLWLWREKLWTGLPTSKGVRKTSRLTWNLSHYWYKTWNCASVCVRGGHALRPRAVAHRTSSSICHSTLQPKQHTPPSCMSSLSCFCLNRKNQVCDSIAVPLSPCSKAVDNHYVSLCRASNGCYAFICTCCTKWTRTLVHRVWQSVSKLQPENSWKDFDGDRCP
jgi:hypothetical protein